ncbi:MAG: hypothetical protein JSV40_12720, partial [Deltaproteobacteria bacterium]
GSGLRPCGFKSRLRHHEKVRGLAECRLILFSYGNGALLHLFADIHPLGLSDPAELIRGDFDVWFWEPFTRKC